MKSLSPQTLSLHIVMHITGDFFIWFD